MTALLVIEAGDLDRVIEVGPEDSKRRREQPRD